MCGEHLSPEDWQLVGTGSSPHVRGALNESANNFSMNGIIPACAGSTPYKITVTDTARDHPRMCGEHFTPRRESWPKKGSSPHVRGALREYDRRRILNGIIPACAGSTGVHAS